MHITNAPVGEKVTVGCDVTLRFMGPTFGLKEESYRIAEEQQKHNPKGGVLWMGSCWGEKLMGRALGDIVCLPAPEENIAEGTIVSIDLN